MTKIKVEEVMVQLVNPWRSDDQPDRVAEMDTDRLFDLIGELKAERDRIEDLIEQVDDLAATRDHEC